MNYIIGELLGELNVSHAYRSGGDLESAPGRSVGYLGCDFALEQGAYRIKRILEVAPWEYTLRSPLRAAGGEGQGRRLAARGEWPAARCDTQDPWAAFQGLGDQARLPYRQ